MYQLLTNGLSHRNGFVRKGSAALLRVPRWLRRRDARPEQFRAAPPVLANSFPKSGTHLLAQVVAGLPDRANYGEFLASMTSSFRFRKRTPDSTAEAIRGMVPGEIVRGHLIYDPQYAEELGQRNVVHCLIYRDPRDVVVSEAHYLREMNRWHRLHPYFRRAASIDDAITLSITGLVPAVPGLEYPNVAERFAEYQGWLGRDDCLAVRFEDLVSGRQASVVEQIARFYALRTDTVCDIRACVERMLACVAPKKSHTFRSGERAGWRREFTDHHRRLFAELAGDLLVRLGYEQDNSWVDRAPASA